MRIALLGDIVGAPGRQAATAAVPWLKQEKRADYIIANSENTADGSGLTADLYKRLKEAGIDGQTLGDHAFRRAPVRAALESAADLIRPANLPAEAWGRGHMKLEKAGLPPIHVMTVIGRIFMNNMHGDDPFECVERWLKTLPPRAIALVEIHAEVTSEKAAMGWHFNGRVACVFGTHTHVPTADERILSKPGADDSIPGAANPFPGGTAFVTDLGMCGPLDSILGRRADRVVKQMTTGIPAAFDVAFGRPVAQGVIVEVDDKSGLATGIERFSLEVKPA